MRHLTIAGFTRVDIAHKYRTFSAEIIEYNCSDSIQRDVYINMDKTITKLIVSIKQHNY